MLAHFMLPASPRAQGSDKEGHPDSTVTKVCTLSAVSFLLRGRAWSHVGSPLLDVTGSAGLTSVLPNARIKVWVEIVFDMHRAANVVAQVAGSERQMSDSGKQEGR